MMNKAVNAAPNPSNSLSQAISADTAGQAAANPLKGVQVISEKSAKIGFVSLGCPKALVDSERILTQLRLEGYTIASDYAGADLVVVNTCGFIETAVQESLDAIGEAIHENGKVIVTGCLGKHEEKIRAMHPSVLKVTGPHAYNEVMDAVHAYVDKPEYNPYVDLVPEAGIRLTPAHYAYLKISEGCNHRCTFCIIPSLRGDLASRPVGSVLNEAQALVKGGVRELLVISQDTSAYGLDVKYALDFWQGQPIKTRFFDLCEALGSMGVWVRLHYVYPYPHVDAVVDLMAQGRILPYLDIPFQHASPRILKLMKRPAHSENTLERIKLWRQKCPQLTLRSTFIVGFPGETEAEFEYLLNWLKEAQLDRVGCFMYSPVDGAAANDLPDQVPEDVKQARYERFMHVQAGISSARLQAKIGTVMQVLVDELDEEYPVAIARSAADAPEIDGNVFVEDIDRNQIKPGQFLQVEITDADAYDLFARFIRIM